MSVVHYLSHPQVNIDPNIAVPDWSLNDTGRARIEALAQVAKQVFAGTTSIHSSPERKARETAKPLAAALNLPINIADDSFENDRSATGFLPPDEFEVIANRFFAYPDVSAQGWERAIDAQNRITAAVDRILTNSPIGDVLVIGHGAVGTLLFCALSGCLVSRGHDQPAGGGNVLTLDRSTRQPLEKWKPIEALTPV